MQQGSQAAANVLAQVRALPLEDLSPQDKAEALQVVHEKLGLNDLENSDRQRKIEGIKVLIEGL